MRIRNAFLALALLLTGGVALAQQVPSLGVQSTQSPNKMVGVDYWQANSAYGGQPPYTYSIGISADSRLPAGTRLDPATGTVSGLPTAAGPFKYLVRVTDARKISAHREVQGTISPNPNVVAVQPADIVYRVQAGNFDSYKYTTVQCAGRNWPFWVWTGSYGMPMSPSPSVVNSTYTGGIYPAYSTVDSVGEPGTSAFQWEVRPTDLDTAGAGTKRCELSLGWKEYSYPGKVLAKQVGLAPNQDLWWAVAVKTEDWGASAGSNDWQSLWQWHDAHGVNGLPPYVAAMAQGNRWFIRIAHDPNRPPQQEPHDRTTTETDIWSEEMPPNTWGRFVVKARKDTVNPADSYLQVWLNGRQIVNYRGPLGYLVPEMDYAKIGVYHWGGKNQWNPAVPARRMWTKGPVQVLDRPGYSWLSIAPLLD